MATFKDIAEKEQCQYLKNFLHAYEFWKKQCVNLENTINNISLF